MSEFDEALAQADADIYAVLGDVASYSNNGASCSCTVIPEENLQPIGDYDAVGMQDHLSILLPVDEPLAGGGIVTLNGVNYQLRRELENDGSSSRWLVQKQ